MSNRLTALAWRTRLGNAAAKAVLVRLCDFADDSGRRVYPSVPTVARDCDLGERTVQEALRRLTSLGLLVLVREADFARRLAREYRIDAEALQEMVSSTSDSRCSSRTGANAAPVQEPHRCGRRIQPVREPHRTGAGAAPQPPEDPPGDPPEGIPPQPPLLELVEDQSGAPGLNVESAFAEWWTAVPIKKAKGAALRAYRTALKRASPAELLTGIRRYAAEVKGREERYIAHPASWLNADRWLDEPARRGVDHDERHQPSRPIKNGFVAIRLEETERRNRDAGDDPGRWSGQTLDLEPAGDGTA